MADFAMRSRIDRCGPLHDESPASIHALGIVIDWLHTATDRQRSTVERVHDGKAAQFRSKLAELGTPRWDAWMTLEMTRCTSFAHVPTVADRSAARVFLVLSPPVVSLLASTDRLSPGS